MCTSQIVTLDLEWMEYSIICTINLLVNIKKWTEVNTNTSAIDTGYC